MAISVNWVTGVITVPKADLTLVQSSPTEIRSLNLDAFRQELKTNEASEDGAPYTDTHSHVAPISVGGVALARVVEILEPYTVTFEDGQYAVNLIGANSNVGDRVNVNQVSVRSANSAGLTYSKEVEDQSFTDSRVWLDTTAGQSGTVFPIGTPGTPVSNLPNAKAIISARTLPKRLQFRGTMNTSGESLEDFNVRGSGTPLSEIVFDGSSTSNLVVENCEISGTMNGAAVFEGCSFGNTTQFAGRAERCGMTGPITLTLVGSSFIEFIDCHSDIPGTGAPTLDFGSDTNTQVSIRDYTGGLIVTNMTDSNSVASIDCISGRITIDSSCTAGTILVGGLAVLNDNSGPGCAVIRRSLDPVLSEQLAGYDEEIVIDAVSGVAGTIYPTGTASQPVDNLADAKTLAAAYGLTNLRIRGTLVLGATDNVDGFTIVGDNPLTSALVLTPGVSTAASEFRNIFLTGQLSGQFVARESYAQNITGIGDTSGPSLFYQCIFLEGVVQMASGQAGAQMGFTECYSGQPTDGGTGVVLDVNGYAGDCQFTDYRGDFSIINSTNAGARFRFGVESSVISMAASNTAGDFRFAGYGGLFKLSPTIGATITNQLNRGTSTGTIQ